MTKPPAAILWSRFLGWALCVSGEGKRAGRWGCREPGVGPRLQAPRRAARWRSGAVGAWQRLRALALSAFARGLGAVPTWSLRGACHADYRAQADFSPLKGNGEGARGCPDGIAFIEDETPGIFVLPPAVLVGRKKTVWSPTLLIFETMLQICLQ